MRECATEISRLINRCQHSVGVRLSMEAFACSLDYPKSVGVRLYPLRGRWREADR